MKPFDKLKSKLAELFQLDQADLDFGIYRIMNARRDEIMRFLEHDLLPQVRDAFAQYRSSDKTELQKELDKVVEGIKAAGMDPDQSPKVQELRAKLAEEAVDVTALENEVYDHLYSFFSRYYEEGDFISLRRYKEGVYAIPYEGEEVKLYWANHDQYYVKTTENFRDYAFNVRDAGRVHFKIVEADTEKDNVKATNDKDRRFLLHGDQPVSEVNDELVIRFEYRPDDEKRKQEPINTATAQRVLKHLDDAKLAVWQHCLGMPWKRADGTEANRSVLEERLHHYTKVNTFDYFIHKDLGGFLRRELDFYIKNEIMRLDDIEEEAAPRVEQYLSKIKVIRQIAHKIIAFLGQIEEFQKKLWLKKKFVVETNYCVTLDRVPEELYPEIAANAAQRQEWVQFSSIDELGKDLSQPVDYSDPLTVDFLKTQPHLVVDTRFFDERFTDTLLASLDDLDEHCDGILAHSENFQALNLFGRRYRRQVKAVYIDPPYNSDAGPICYKNGYPHSSWIALVRDRLKAAAALLSPDAISCVTIDDNEAPRLRLLLDSCYPTATVLGIVPIKNNPAGRTGTVGFSVCHEYAFFYGHSDDAVVNRLDHSEEQKARYKEKDELGFFEWTNFRKHGGLNTYREARPRQFYPIYVGAKAIRIPEMTWDKDTRQYIVHEPPREDEETLWPIDSKGRERIWDFVVNTARRNIDHFMVKEDATGKTAIYRKWRIHGEGPLPQTWWDKSEYSAVEYGTNLLTRMFGETHVFVFPKSIVAVADCLRVSGLRNCVDGLALDYFAGSGTTGHAVIDLNRRDGGQRKYILVEMGDYFDTVLMPRIKKAVYSKDWRDGRPVSREGLPHMFKYIRLESYEDALANIELTRAPDQQLLLDKGGAFRESYMLRYLLETEAEGSQTLLNVDHFDDPWGYRLLVGTGSVGETKPVNVDLVETFNWLLGLRVKHVDRIGGFHVVDGTNPKDERVLVIWRKIRELTETDPKKIAPAREKANLDLETFFRKQQYNTLDSEYDIIYVNGDNNLMNVPVEPEKEGVEPRYKVRMIEEEFKRLMFDVKDV